MMVTIESGAAGLGAGFGAWLGSIFGDEDPTAEECEQVALDLDAMGNVALARKLRGQVHSDAAASSELVGLDAETRERVNDCTVAAGAAEVEEADESLTPEERAELAHAGFLECVAIHGPFSGVCVGGTAGTPTDVLATVARDEIDRREKGNTLAIVAAGALVGWLLLRSL